MKLIELFSFLKTCPMESGITFVVVLSDEPAFGPVLSTPVVIADHIGASGGAV